MEEKKTNKKTIILASIGVLLVLLFSFFATSIKEKQEKEALREDILTTAQKESKSISEKEQKPFVDITIDEYLEIYGKQDTSLVLIYKTNCNYCKIAEPILKNLIYQYNLTIYGMNIDNFTSEDKKKLLESDEYFTQGLVTPLLLIVKEKKFVDKVEGLLDQSHYKEFLEAYDFIKK